MEGVDHWIQDRLQRRQALQIPLRWKCPQWKQPLKHTHWSDACDAIDTAEPIDVLQIFRRTKSEQFNGKKDKFTLLRFLLNTQRMDSVTKMLE